MSSLSEIVTDTLSSIGASLLTDLMILLLLGIFITAVILRLRNQAIAFTNYVPTLLTIVGLLGTFSGILVGLLEFNIQKIDGSIGALLGGLKTAFIASLTGIILSVIYKTLISTELLKPLPEYCTEQEDNLAEEEVQATLQAQLLTQNKQYQLAQEQVRALLQLNNQLQGFESRLDHRITQISQDLAHSATQEITTSLGTAIHDFNHHLTQQLGEQFGHLDHAITQLVTWQAEHKEQMIHLQEQHQQNTHHLQQLYSLQQESHDFWQSNTQHLMTQLHQQVQQTTAQNQHQLSDMSVQFDQFRKTAQQLFGEQLQHTQATAHSLLMQQLDHLNHTMQQHITQTMNDFVHFNQQMLQRVIDKQEPPYVNDGINEHFNESLRESYQAENNHYMPASPSTRIPGVVTDPSQVPPEPIPGAITNLAHTSLAHIGKTKHPRKA